jgi:hypothetical protein
MIALSTAPPSDMPIEPTDTQVKVAAAEAAQATANAAQDVADGCRKDADEAIAGDPNAATQKIDIRGVNAEATQTLIHMLRKINGSKP